jgi:GNAT superfamily N-acetyltransferase
MVLAVRMFVYNHFISGRNNANDEESPKSNSEDSEDDTDDIIEEGDTYRHMSEDDPDLGSEYEEFAEFKWLEQMDGEITLKTSPDSELKQIGYCNSKLIRRNGITSFYADMEEPTRDTAELAFDLFDRYGRLRQEFKEHPIKKGSGIWQKEIDQGDLLLFERVSIQKPYRRRGLGRRVVDAMLETTRRKSPRFFAFVSPGYLTRELDEEVEGLQDEEARIVAERHIKIALTFWRSLGFRRVGSSSWLALPSKKDHPCYELSSSNDYDLPEPPQLIPQPEMKPLLDGLITMNCQNWIEMAEKISQNISAQDPHWLATDANGNTILHLAAVTSKSECVKWILSKAPEMLRNIRNHAGETALEALEFHLESERTKRGLFTRMFPVSDLFEGFREESVMCLIKLKSLVDVTESEKTRLKYGCTCGECLSGFLSRRMRLAIQCQADIHHDLFNSTIDEGNGEHFVQEFEEDLKFVQDYVRENLKTNKSMRQGFANICLHFATCTQKDNILGVPTEPNVLLALRDANEWPPASKNFLQRGGTVYSVGSMLFEAAMSQDWLAGDGEFLEVYGDEILKLPECRNDHEFGFVRAMCGYKRVNNLGHVLF